jgi:hypothetical protein
MLSLTQQHDCHRRYRLANALGVTLLLLMTVSSVEGWGSSNGDADMSIYSDAYSRDWLYDGSSIALKIDGCVRSFVQDGEDSGCMEQESDTGTTYWYQMSNCKRANVAYSLYSGTSCSSSNFKEAVRIFRHTCHCSPTPEGAHFLIHPIQFVGTAGLSEFVQVLKTYDANNPFGDGDDDGGNNGSWDIDELPMCEAGNNGYYIGVGCGSDGSFTIDYFSDAYCQVYVKTYDYLSTINYKLQQYKNCATIYSSGDDSNAAQYLIAYSETCSAMDSSYCSDSSSMSNRKGSTILHKGSGSASGYYKSWGTKAKYVMGGLLLLAAFIMFTGILFTNRRRRRALLQRKFRQRHRSSKTRKSSKSRSKSRDAHTSARSSSSRRTKSRTRVEESGVLT